MDGGATEDAGGGSFAILGGLERWGAYWSFVVRCIVLCGSILLNSTLLLAFIRRPGLRTISNRFVMNLIGSNLLTNVVLLALMIMDSCGISNYLSSSSVLPSFCAISEGATALIMTSSIFSVLLIGLDQYLAVVDPLRYRTRIDKLKCGLLILAVWLLALVFGVLASLNPEPRSLWYLCSDRSIPANGGESMLPGPKTEMLRVRASIVLAGNATEHADLEIDGEFRFAESRHNSTDAVATAWSGGATYGMVYALVYALLVYLLPFFGICWIYVSIYLAARNNSERTRRTGSRPVLSSGSFSEEGSASNYRADCLIEDFRRIPKISSLSSIDENSEATHSQLGIGQPLGSSTEHMQRRDGPLGEQAEEDEEEKEESPAVIFTLGSTKVDAGQPDEQAKDSTKSKVPISALRAKFLSESRPQPEEQSEELGRSKFPAVSEQRRKSSHDLMFEEMMLSYGKHPYEYDSSCDEENEDAEEEEEEEGRADYEESRPLSEPDGFARPEGAEPCTHSSTRSISVNFDLGETGQEPTGTDGRRRSSDCPQVASGPGSPSHPLPIVTITPPGQKPMPVPGQLGLHRVPSVKSTHSYINNLKYKISNGSLFKYREETRAARISALVVVMGLICWTPYAYLLLLRNLPEAAGLGGRDSSPGLDMSALGFLVLATYVSPLLFGYRSRRVKRELQRFFCFKRELSYKNNRSLMAKKVLRRRHSGATILSQFMGCEAGEQQATASGGRYGIFNCVYGRNRWPKEKVQFVQVPDTALAVETCRSSFSSGASTQISSTSTDDC